MGGGSDSDEHGVLAVKILAYDYLACACDYLAACHNPFWNSISVSPAACGQHFRARLGIVEGSREDQVQDRESWKGHP